MLAIPNTDLQVRMQEAWAATNDPHNKASKRDMVLCFNISGRSIATMRALVTQHRVAGTSPPVLWVDARLNS